MKNLYQTWTIGGSGYAVLQNELIVEHRRFNKPDKENENLICTYSITEPGETLICYNISNVESIIVDGVSMDPVDYYNFEEAGEHTVEFVLVDKTLINEEMFYDCSTLISISIPNSIKVIENWAFDSCKSLESIHIGNGITNIGNMVFSNSDNLVSITMDENDYFYVENNVLVDKSNYSTLKIANIEHIVIPEGVKSISGLSNNKKLKTITLNEQLERIENNCFRTCSNLESIIIPDSVTYLGDSAFMSCYALKSVIIGNGVLEILQDTFGGCKLLESITIPNSVTSIRESAFSNCSMLKSITIGNGITSIGRTVFMNCSSLVEIICLAIEPITFDSMVFYGLPSVGVLKVPADSNTGLKDVLPSGWTVRGIGEAPPEQLGLWVDLGLPSGTLWSDKNVGASKPEESGLYFAWGETEGYTDGDVISGKKAFSWDDYKFGTSDNLTKYNSTDTLTQLELVDDAAYQLDDTCRIPTKEDFKELFENTTVTWETLNDIQGMRLTSYNGNSIFIPAAGRCINSSVEKYEEDPWGLYWSSSRTNNSKRAYYADFYLEVDLEVIFDVSISDRMEGYPIRPVRSK